MSVGAVIFDFDGTLFRLATDWPRLRRELDERFGLSGTVGEHTERAQATGDGQALRIVEEAERAGLAAGVWLAGAAAVLDALERRGIAVAIFTRNSREIVREALAELAVDREPLVCGREDVARQKPDPEGLRLLLGRLGVASSHALMVGDSRADVEAARAAGVVVAIVKHRDVREPPDGADHYLASLKSLLALAPSR